MVSDSTYAADAMLYADWLEALNAANAEIGGTKLQETNEALINALYIDYLRYGQDSLNGEEINAIGQMALQCPLVGGAAVYKARTLYSLYRPAVLYDDLDICNSQGVYKGIGKGIFDDENSLLAGQNVDAVSGFKIYPNPTTGMLTIVYTHSGKLEVTDMVGRKIASCQLMGNKTTFSLPVEKMTSGIYLYRYMVNDKQIEIGKLVLIK